MGDSIEAAVTQFLRRTLANGAVRVQELEGRIGHNLPQEAPLAFAQAVVDVARG